MEGSNLNNSALKELSKRILIELELFFLFLFIGVLRRFQHYFSATVHLFMIPVELLKTLLQKEHSCL